MVYGENEKGSELVTRLTKCQCPEENVVSNITGGPHFGSSGYWDDYEELGLVCNICGRRFEDWEEWREWREDQNLSTFSK